MPGSVIPRWSGIYADLGEEVATFADGPLAGATYLYVFLHATNCKARVNHRVVA